MLTRLLRWNRVSGKVLTLGPSTRRSIEKVQRTLKPQRLYPEVRPEGKGTSEGVSFKQHTNRIQKQIHNADISRPDEAGKSKKKARALALIFRKYYKTPDLRNPGNQRVNALKRK